jgi:xanthine dehydrogenase accessory factor
MTDLDQILPLWEELRRSETEYVLATVVAVEGSGYRKPGARMLIAADGRRTGTISGGCLEGEVARKAFWRTEDGPVVRRYSTSAEDGDVPYGMGCGGIVHLLLERSATAEPVLLRLAASFKEREPLAIATVVDGRALNGRALDDGALDGRWIGRRGFWPGEAANPATGGLAEELADLACEGFEEQRSFTRTIRVDEGQSATVRVEWKAARPGLFIFGAGDDAVPLVRQARQLGWYVAVADGRSNLATQARFPEAHDVHVLTGGELGRLSLRPTDAAAVMTHSLEQDSRILSTLIGQDLDYIGVLGPRRRTEEMLVAIAGELAVPESRIDTQLEEWMDRLHAPMGLDLGGDTPADIALAVMAEIQQCRHGASGMALRVVRTQGAEATRIAVPNLS